MAILKGKGIAAVNYPAGMNLGGDPTQALLHMSTTGSFFVNLSSTDLGQGLKTVIAQLVAETLEVPFENVRVNTANTDSGPHCMGTFASRATHRAGNAAILAAREAKEVMFEVAGLELGVPPYEVVSDHKGNLHVKGDPSRSISLVDMGLKAHFKHGKMVAGRGIYMKSLSPVNPETGEMDPDSTMSHACTVAEVEVDTATGQVKVTSLKSAYDCGIVINPKLVEGQIVGGSFMGMAHALYETTDPYYPDTAYRSRSYSDYILPGPAELPVIECMTIEAVPSSNGPCGAKSIGEMTANSPIPAIINAIADAIGVHITCLPITPEKVLKAIREKEALN